MNYGSSELNVAHSFATNFLSRDFYSATFANNSLETNSLVLTAGTFPVFGRTKDFLAEKPVFFRLEGPVVNGLRLFYLTV